MRYMDVITEERDIITKNYDHIFAIINRKYRSYSVDKICPIVYVVAMSSSQCVNRGRTCIAV